MTPEQKLRASGYLDINRLASEARMDKVLGVSAAPGYIEVREERLQRALHKLNVASHA